MVIVYKDTKNIEALDVSRVFKNSGIKRPDQDLERLERMIQHADVVITAWKDEVMIGIARALTDYSYCCYLSELAVDVTYQKSGIGQELIARVRERIGNECSLVLISAPGATSYYPKVGFEYSDKAYMIKRER